MKYAPLGNTGMYVSPLTLGAMTFDREDGTFGARIGGTGQELATRMVDLSIEAGINLFLHMGLHLGIREQIATNRPAGIRSEFERLATKTGDVHTAEHRMIDCLAETLWEAQRSQQPPDEARYLESLRQL